MQAEARRPASAGGRIVTCLALLALAACGGNVVRDSAPVRSPGAASLPDDPLPRPEARSRYGNGPVYEVFGKQYTVLPTSAGYRERGVASWYGRKFHGRLTSSREPYDMYAMTAAHKSLPLPTYVRVRNLRNNRSIIVRVNDRGPFVHNRIIDLSYAAALKLDMVQDGTSLVEVEAISFDGPVQQVRTDRISAQPPAPPAATNPVSVQARDTSPRPRPDLVPVPAHEAGPAAAGSDNVVYVQVGAFGSRDNAERRLDKLRSARIPLASIATESGAGTTLYRVRIGPVVDADHYDRIVAALAEAGIDDPWLVGEPRP